MKKKKEEKTKINKRKLIKISLHLILGLISGIILSLLFINYLLYQQHLRSLRKELNYWKEVTRKNPYYPDSWAKLAVIWYNLKQKELAGMAIEKARKLDPIRKELINLEKIVK